MVIAVAVDATAHVSLLLKAPLSLKHENEPIYTTLDHIQELF